MKFFIIIGDNAIYTYEKLKNGDYEPRYINGECEYPFDPNSVAADIDSFLKALALEKNLISREDLENIDNDQITRLLEQKLRFIILWGDKRYLNDRIYEVIKGHMDKDYSLENTLERIIKKLSADPGLRITEYGVNYEGNSYKISDGVFMKGDFDLLAYTIHTGEIKDAIFA